MCILLLIELSTPLEEVPQEGLFNMVVIYLTESCNIKALKRPTTVEEQLKKLIARGCQVTNYNDALEVLTHINYYRLTAYFLPFKESNDMYKVGTKFENIIKIYEFDKKLRSLLSQQIENIEIMFRMRIAYMHCQKYGTDGYLDPFNFRDSDRHKEMMEHIEKYINRNLRLN